MTATNHTEHYELSQYTDEDHPTYTSDYNGDMAKIDAAIYAASQSGGLAAVAYDDTLTGAGTKNIPLGIRRGTAINPIDNQWNAIDFNDFYNNGIYTLNGDATNGPFDGWTTGALIVLRSYQLIMQLCFFRPSGDGKSVAYRFAPVDNASSLPTAEKWKGWRFIV